METHQIEMINDFATKNKRIDSVDMAKGVGMICVVVGHLWCYHDLELSRRLVYPFHMPLFFIAAGMVLSLRGPLCDFIKHKARQLIVPFLIFGFAGVALSALLGATPMCGVFPRIVGVCYGCTQSLSLPFFGNVPAAGIIWFLEALFVGSVLVRLFYPFKYGIAVIVGLAILSLLSVNSGLPWMPANLQSGCVGAVYVVVGKLCVEHRWMPPSRCWIPAGLLVYVFCVFKGWIVWLGFASLTNPLMLVLSVVICLALWGVLDPLCRRDIAKPVLFIGRHSLVVFFFHHLYLSGGVQQCVTRHFMCGWLGIAIELLFPFCAMSVYVGVKSIWSLVLQSKEPIDEIH